MEVLLLKELRRKSKNSMAILIFIVKMGSMVMIFGSIYQYKFLLVLLYFRHRGENKLSKKGEFLFYKPTRTIDVFIKKT